MPLPYPTLEEFRQRHPDVEADQLTDIWERGRAQNQDEQRNYPSFDVFRQRHPEVDSETIQTIHAEGQRLHEARQRHSYTSQPVARYVQQRSIPFLSSIGGIGEARQFGRAMAAAHGGTASDDDYNTIARYEAEHRIAANRTTGEEVASGLAHLPAIVGEAVVGGAALRAAGIGATAAPSAIQAAGFGATRFSAGQAGVNALNFAGRTAAQTAVMPSMWAPQWVEQNVANNRDPVDFRGLPSAYAMGFMNTAVLGSLNGVANGIGGNGLRDIAKRTLLRTATGMVEQNLGVDLAASAISELLPKAYKLQTGYGLLGHLATHGADDGFWKHAITQAVTFGAFSILHEIQTPHEAVDGMRDALKEARDANLSQEQAAQYMAERMRPNAEGEGWTNNPRAPQPQGSPADMMRGEIAGRTQPRLPGQPEQPIPSSGRGALDMVAGAPDAQAIGSVAQAAQAGQPERPNALAGNTLANYPTPVLERLARSGVEGARDELGRRNATPQDMPPQGPQPGMEAMPEQPAAQPPPEPTAQQKLTASYNQLRAIAKETGLGGKDSAANIRLKIARDGPELSPLEALAKLAQKTGHDPQAIRATVDNLAKSLPPGEALTRIVAHAFKPRTHAGKYARAYAESLAVAPGAENTSQAHWEAVLAREGLASPDATLPPGIDAAIKKATNLGLPENERLALEGVLRGGSYYDVSDSGMVKNAKGESASHTTVKTFAERAFQKIKDSVPEFKEFDTHGEYLTSIKADKAHDFADAVTTIADDGTVSRDRAVENENIDRIIAEAADQARELGRQRDLYHDELERDRAEIRRIDEQLGIPEIQTDAALEKADEGYLAARKERLGLGKTKGNSRKAESQPGQLPQRPDAGVGSASDAQNALSQRPQTQASNAENTGAQGAAAQPEVNRAEPMPPAEMRASGGTFGEGPLVPVGSQPTLGLSEAKINEARVADTLGLVDKRMGITHKVLWAKTRERAANNPGEAARLAQYVVESNGEVAINAADNLLLLHRRLAIRNEMSQLRKDAIKSFDSDSAYMRIQRQMSDLAIERDLIDHATSLSGSEAGLSLNVRRLLAKYDYSLEGLVQQAQAANKGKPISKEQLKELSDLADKVQGLQEKLDAAEEKLRTAGTGSKGPEFTDFIGLTAQTKIAQTETDRRVNRFRWDNLSPAMKITDWIKRIRVAELISSPITAAKVGINSMLQMVASPTHEAIASAWRQVPGIRVFAENAPIEGTGFKPGVELDAIKSVWGTGRKAAWDTLWKGASDLDMAFGARDTSGRPYSWIDLIGNLHGAEKAPAVEAAFTRAFQHLETFEHAAGRDVTSPEALIRIGERSYERALAERFQNDNAAVKAFNYITHSLKTSESSGAQALGHGLDLALPIVRTPTNIIISGLEHTLGLPIGVLRARLQHANGIGELTRPQAEGIMRQLKRGTLGLPLFFLGYYMAGNVGGFYSGKRKEDDVEAGAIRTPLGTVPGWMASHHPALMALQLGATWRRAEETIRHGEPEGPVGGLAHATGAMLEEVPFVREQVRLSRPDRWAEDLARSFAIPKFVEWLAQLTDKRDGNRDLQNMWLGQPQQHRPGGAMDRLRMGVPWLRRSAP